MLRPDFTATADIQKVAHFGELQRRFERMEDSVKRVREAVIAGLDLDATRSLQYVNGMVKVVAVVFAIIGLVRAIVDVFGMNFDTAFNHWGAMGCWLTPLAMLMMATPNWALTRIKNWV